jgi:hypothetical protein
MLASADGDADASTPDAAEPELRLEKLPNTLTCVTDAVNGDVLRVQRGTGPDGAPALTVSAGSQFRVHEGGARFSEESELDPSTFSLELQRDGLAFTGALIDDQCYVIHSRPVTCWDPAELFSSPLLSRYDRAKGRCLDAAGQPRLNRLPIELVRETGFGECADLSGLALNGDDFGYPFLGWWSLQGARLDGAMLHFAELSGASLAGADLRGMEFGYASISGSVDEHTRVPADGCAIAEDNPWAGPQLACAN